MITLGETDWLYSTEKPSHHNYAQGLSNMPAKDIYHDLVKDALIAEGWTITHDPLLLRAGVRHLYVDLGARKLLAAHKGSTSIAVEIKAFTAPSMIHSFESALGQYMVYRSLLRLQKPDYVLYLAVPRHVYESFFSEMIGELIISEYALKLIIYDIAQGTIQTWIE